MTTPFILVDIVNEINCYKHDAERCRKVFEDNKLVLGYFFSNLASELGLMKAHILTEHLVIVGDAVYRRHKVLNYDEIVFSAVGISDYQDLLYFLEYSHEFQEALDAEIEKRKYSSGKLESFMDAIRPVVVAEKLDES